MAAEEGGDLLDMPVERVSNREISSMRAALLAAETLGEYACCREAEERMTGVGRTFFPSEERRQAFLNLIRSRQGQEDLQGEEGRFG